MAVTLVSHSAVVYSTTATSIAPNYPASPQKGDLIVLHIGMKPDTATITVPSGFTLPSGGEQAGGGGTTGIDTGPTRAAYMYKVSDGTESGTETVTLSGNNIAYADMILLRNSTGEWDIAATGGTDSTTGAAWSVTGAANPGIQADDLILASITIPTDVTTPGQFGTYAFTATGATFSTPIEIEEFDSSLGQDIGGASTWLRCDTGTASAAPVFTATAGGTTTNVRGPSVFFRARQVGTAAPGVYRIWPSTNGAPNVGVDTSNYTLGTEFEVDQDNCWVTALWLWAASDVPTNAKDMRIYQVDSAAAGTAVSGTDVNTGTLTQNSWNRAPLSAPVKLTKGQRYRVVNFFTVDNGYAATTAYWTTGGGANGIVQGPIYAPNSNDAVGQDQGSFIVTSSMAFPTSSGPGHCYWVDVEITVAPLPPSRHLGQAVSRAAVI